MSATNSNNVGAYGEALLLPPRHTQGGFTVAHGDDGLVILAPDPDPDLPGVYGYVAMMIRSDFPNQAEANATLFRAAPKLLAAIKAIVLETMGYSPVKPVSSDSYLPAQMISTALDAIADAEGWK